MKVILRENIENLGKKGDIINVAPGYARNYLIPKKIALEVTSTNNNMIEMEQKALRKGLEQEMKSYQALSARLNEVELTFTRKAGDKDAIFGSVSVSDIKEALEKRDFVIEKKRILLVDPLKKLGNYSVPIKVFHEEKAEIKVAVVREGGEEKLQPKAVAPEEEATPAAETPEIVPDAETPETATAEPEAATTTEEAEAETAPEPKSKPDEKADTAAEKTTD